MGLKSVSSPIISEPVHALGEAVAIMGHVAGAQVKVFRYKAITSGLEVIGNCTAPLHDVVNIGVTRLETNDMLFAVQEIQVDGATVKSADPPNKLLKAIFPPIPLSPPYVRPTLYACARKVTIGNILNGATVEVFRDGRMFAKGAIGFPHVSVNVNPPLEARELIHARQYFLDINAAESAKEKVVPYPESKLPTPIIREPLYECAPSFEVEGLIPGALLMVFEEQSGDTIAREVAADPVCSVEVNGGLQHGWKLFAVQELCGPTDRSDESPRVDVEEVGCFGSWPTDQPRFLQLPRAGDTFVLVDGLHESSIEVLANGVSIAGGTCFGPTVLALNQPLGNVKLQLISSLNCPEREWEVRGGVVSVAREGEVRELTESNYNSTLASSSLPVMVDFWATWCPPCLKAAPKVKKLAQDYAGKALIAKVDKDKYNPLGLGPVPTFAFFEAGKTNPKTTITGWDEPKIRHVLDTLIAP
ncbi:thioredoxin family protein [Candidatus Bipolaricaulota bacterium]